jgi:hypothetical protein
LSASQLAIARSDADKSDTGGRLNAGSELLVIERGWSLDDWETWIAESAAALLLR